MKLLNCETVIKVTGLARVALNHDISRLIIGVTKAVRNINETIAPALIEKNLDLTNQKAVDEFLLQLDGTKNKCT